MELSASKNMLSQCCKMDQLYQHPTCTTGDVVFFFFKGKPLDLYFLANSVTSAITKGIMKLGGFPSQKTSVFESKAYFARWCATRLASLGQ